MSLGLALPTGQQLLGELVRLEPLTAAHLPDLKRIAFAHPAEFSLTSTPRDEAEAEEYFSRVLAEQAAGSAYPVAVITLQDERVVGTSRLSEINSMHRRCELGFSWYDPTLFRSGVNTDSKLLLLSFAFETLHLIRVQIQADTRNLRSQGAITALGARYEGVLKRHQIAKDGYVRDTMIYAITDFDWPEVRQKLRERIERRRLNQHS